MYTALDWPWGRTLAVSPVGQVLQVEDILFSTVHERLGDLGIRIGSVLECLGTEGLSIRLRLPDGREELVSRAYAWFVCTRCLVPERSSARREGGGTTGRGTRLPVMAHSLSKGPMDVG